MASGGVVLLALPELVRIAMSLMTGVAVVLFRQLLAGETGDLSLISAYILGRASHFLARLLSDSYHHMPNVYLEADRQECFRPVVSLCLIPNPAADLPKGPQWVQAV